MAHKEIDQEIGLAVTDEEVGTVRQHLATLDLRVQAQGQENQIVHPVSMDCNRYIFVLHRMSQQQDGNLFACLDDAFAHEWVVFDDADFNGLKKEIDKSITAYLPTKLQKLFTRRLACTRYRLLNANLVLRLIVGRTTTL